MCNLSNQKNLINKIQRTKWWLPEAEGGCDRMSEEVQRYKFALMT